MKPTLVYFLQLFILIYAKECSLSGDNSTVVFCANSTISSYSNFSNMTQLSIVYSELFDLPDLSNFKQLESLYLDHNHIELITRSYSTVKILSLTSNRIYALHQTNLSYPNLEYFDLSHNPIEHITRNYFSNLLFPRLKVLKFVNALKHLNLYIIDEHFLSFSLLNSLSEIYFDDNHFEEFLCSKSTEHIQWRLPINLKKLSLRNNKLHVFDGNCLTQMSNLTELDLHSNQLIYLSPLNFTLPSLTKVQLDENAFVNISVDFFRSTPQLNELDLSRNPLNVKQIQLKKQPIFPSNLKILYLDGLSSDLSCSLFENLIQLEELSLANLASVRLKNCLFKKLINLRLLNLSNHHLKTFDESVFRPLLIMKQLDSLDITSQTLRCHSCSLRWVNEFLKIENMTDVICLNEQEQEISLNTVNSPSCSSNNLFFILMTIISIVLLLVFLVLLLVCLDKQRKYQFTNFRPVYHMIPLRHYHDRIYQETTEDITNDNVMLVT
ncbi:unnamed protein product [Adineta ricciae]|uniref:Uncharacterized protein n=1 Tax=Adineta ricciae TaxID=249248 RepID=A0A813PGP3_ADIRI|nr:unnamed protein product [Adineta ricciae]CAF0854621.1 unnamed protein product [Adineta ricciae]